MGAALNILETYDSGPTGHQDQEIVKVACKSLEDNYGDRLSEDEKELVKKAYRKLSSYGKSEI